MLEAPFAGPKVKGEYVRECVAATGSQGRTDNLLDGRRTLLSGHGLDARFGTDGSYASGRGGCCSSLRHGVLCRCAATGRAHTTRRVRCVGGYRDVKRLSGTGFGV